MKKLSLVYSLLILSLAAHVSGLVPDLVNNAYADENAIKEHTWAPLGGQLKRGLSVITRDSSITVFGVGQDDALWTIESKDKGVTWDGFVGHPDNIGLGSAPACAYEPNTVATIICYFKKGGQLYRIVTEQGNAQTATGSYGFGKFLTSAPDVVYEGNEGNNNVFARADDNALWYTTTKAGQGQGNFWKSLGGQLNGRPSCMANIGSFGKPIAVPYYFIICYVVGSDKAIWMWKNSVWSPLGGQAMDGISAFRPKGLFGEASLAVRGTDSTLWLAQKPEQATEWQWKNYPGEIASDPACSATYCFAILPDGQLGFLDLTGQL